jgi:Arc/MetJ family transcription regulator
VDYFGSMKTTIDIPAVTLDEAMKFTGAKTKREAVVTAVERFNRLKRLERLNARVRGQFRDFMTQADLKAMRAADIPKARR